MGKIKRILLLLVVAVFFGINPVNAASKCDYNEQVELNNAAANIKATYEEAKGKVDPSLIIGAAGGNDEAIYYYLKVQIYNLTEDVYLRITNDVNNEVKYLHYKDSQSGVIEFDWKDLDKVVNFTITVYSSTNTNCPNEEYRKINLTLPRYNKYSDRVNCINNESFYLCQKYITSTEEIDEATFDEKLTAFINKTTEEENIRNEANKTWNEKVSDFIKENKVTIIVISTIIVIGGVVTTVIVIKKRRSRLI